MKLTTTNDIKFHIDYDTNIEYDCESFNCDSICRCGTITGYIYNKFDIRSAFGFIRDFSSSSLEEKYMEAMWLKNQTVLDKWFDPCIISGYYGEETGKITATQDFVDLFNNFISLNPQEKFKKALEAEYGYVLPDLADKTNFSIKIVPIKGVFADTSGQRQLKKKVLDDLYFCIKHVDKNHLNFVENKERLLYLMPMCISTNDGKWRVVDGHHRYNVLSTNFSSKKRIGIFAIK